jgi:TonB-linked SusC/RagA family outer membrane protein
MKKQSSFIREHILQKIILLISICSCSAFLFAQGGIKVSGKVSDSSGPMPGVNIVVKGTNNATITNADGNYSIDLTNLNSSTLVFSFVGYVTQEIFVSGRTKIDVRMLEDTRNLDEVIVVGYGSQAKRNVTGSISNVNSESITRSTSTSLSGALAGKIQGVTTRAVDARPGNGVNLEVRNMENPLYVIDGIPYGGITGLDAFGLTQGSGADVFNSLSLEDIESISILKDASAAIYGLRAANGVVLVTTKKGKRNENVNINVNGYYGLQNFTRYPQPANAGQFVRAMVESEQNFGRDPSLLYSQEELAKWEAGKEAGYKSYDYFKIVTRPNVPQYYVNTNVSGGTERSNYYLSVAHTGQEAMIRDFNYERTNIQANIDASISQGLTVGAQVSAKLENTHNVGVPGLDDYFNPLLSVFTMWPTESPYANDNPKYINQTHNVNVNPATYKDDVTGWIEDLKRSVNVNAYVKYDFKFGLSAKATYSYNFENEDFDGFEYTYPAYKYNKETDTYETQPSWGNQNPWRERHKRNVGSRYTQFQLSYKKQLGNHDFSAVAAYEQSDYDNTYFVVHTVPSNNYVELMSLSEQDYLADEWNYQARAGYIGRLNYNYKGKYLVEVLGRYDGSYLYAPEKRWGFFPGISLGWRISDETFFKDIKRVVNDLKIRASYGETGSEEGVSAHGYLGGYNFRTGSSVLDGSYVIGLGPRGLPVTNLTWVTNATSNIGIDVAFMERKLNITSDIFQRKRTGLPAARYDVVLPSEVGYSLPNENLNSDAHRGIEGIITYSDKVGDLNYTISANTTYSRLRMLESYKPRFGNSWDEYRNSIENRWNRITWGYQIEGRFQSADEINNYPVNIDGQGNRSLLPGDFKYKDVNGDGIINNLDERPIGYALGRAPYIGYGLNSMLEWKGISLSLDFSGAGMQSYLRNWEIKYPFQNDGSAPSYMFTDRWHQADPYDKNSPWISGTYPAVRKGFTGHSNFSRTNDFWLTNVRYFRLKNVELGYAFPEKIINKIGASKLRVYVNGANLFSFDNVADLEIDPEISLDSGLIYPLQKLVIVGINISF